MAPHLRGTYRGMAPGVQLLSYGFEYDGSGIFLYSNPGDMESDYSEAISTWGADVANNSIGSNVSINGFPCDITGDYGVTAALMARDAADGERHDRLISSSVDAMLCVDPGGRITLANPAAEVLLGQRAIGANLFDWIDTDDQPLVPPPPAVPPLGQDPGGFGLPPQGAAAEQDHQTEAT